MTIRFIQSWNGYQPDQIVSGLTNEATIIAAGIARSDIDGDNDGEAGLAKWSTDASGGTVLVGPDGGIIPTLGGEVYTAGAGGMYSTIQAAVDAALAESQFEETALTGTATFTKGSRVVTGVGTAFTTEFLYATHISVTTGGIRKWYPIDGSIQSDTIVVLALPFMDNTVAAAGIVAGIPAKKTVLAVSDSTETITIGDGTANSVACLDLNLNGYRFNLIGANVSSGEITVRNSSYVKSVHNSANYVGDFVLSNLQRKRASSGFDADWIALGGGTAYAGRVYADRLHATGNFDLFMPFVLGRFDIVNSSLRSIPGYHADSAVSNQPVSAMFAASNAIGFIGNCQLSAACYGGGETNLLSFDGFDNELSDFTANNTLTVKDTFFTAEKTVGATENTITRAIYLGVNDSDLYFDNVRFSYTGNPTPGSSWRHIANQAGVTTPSRIHYNACKLLDLRSITTNGVTTSLYGDRGVKALTVAATLDTNELSALRGSVFTVALGATLITSIPSVTNAPEGTEIHFVFTQDATGGRNVGGWNAAYKFHTAWSNTGNTANKQSLISFKKCGASWVQTGAANTWI